MLLDQHVPPGSAAADESSRTARPSQIRIEVDSIDWYQHGLTQTPTLLEVAAWGLSETDATTLGGVHSFLTIDAEQWASALPDDMQGAPLRDLVKVPDLPHELIHDWVTQLSEGDKFILIHRMGTPEEHRSLEAIGQHLGISREWVRRKALDIEHRLRDYLHTASSHPIRWRLASIRKEVGIAIAFADISHLVDPPLPHHPYYYAYLLLRLAGPYHETSGWLVLESSSGRDPTPSLVEACDRFGRVNREQGEYALTMWGLNRSRHVGWMTRNGKVRLLNGDVVRWGYMTLADQVAYWLNSIGEPTTAEELRHNGSFYQTTPTIRNTLSGHDRFTRVGTDKYALTEWRLPQYRGTAESIRELITTEGPMNKKDVVAAIHDAYGVREATIRAFIKAAAFVTTGTTIRLRLPGEDYIPRGLPAREVVGLFVLGPRRVALLQTVDSNMLRGSGRALAPAIAPILDLHPNQTIEFSTEDGTHTLASVTFSDTAAHVGPSLSTVRKLAIAANASVGDYLTLTLDNNNQSAAAVITRPAQPANWNLVARLTGIDPARTLAGLADAIGCDQQDVNKVLELRGDHAVLEALPPAQETTRIVT